MDDLVRKRRELIVRGAGLVSVMCVYMTFFILRRARQNTPMISESLEISIEVDGSESGQEGSGGGGGAAGFGFGVESGPAADTPWKDSSSRSCGKRKTSSFLSEEDALLFSNMCDAVRELASAIKSTVHAEAHPGVYKAVMDLSSFPVDSRFAVLENLMEKKAMSLAFLQMDEEARARWVTHFLAKHPDA